MASESYGVELTYDNHRLLAGTVAVVSIELAIELPVSADTARGTYGNDAISATWSIASNYNATEQPASLEATFAGEAVSLATTLHLAGPNHPRLVNADVTGLFGGDPVFVHVAPGTETWQSIVLDGRVGTGDIVLVAEVDAPVATIRGTVDGELVELTATRSQINWRTLEIEGRWHGPRSLCVLAACALSYFV